MEGRILGLAGLVRQGSLGWGRRREEQGGGSEGVGEGGGKGMKETG